jgi:hypothetical protein
MITALLQMLWQKQKAASGLSIPRQVWVTVSKQITLGYKSFGLQEFLGIIMLQYLMQMLKYEFSNEIVANGGLNGVMLLLQLQMDSN